MICSGRVLSNYVVLLLKIFFVTKIEFKGLENLKKYDNYFTREIHKMKLLRPFEIINQTADYEVRGNVTGGGLTGQVGALVHGISKALLQFDVNLKSTLKKEKLTTRDSRAVERKKYGHRKARRSFQFSKR